MQQLSRAEVRALVMASFPSGYLEATFQRLWDAYRTAGTNTSHMRRPERKSVFAHIRRAEFEHGWQDVSRGFPGVSVSLDSNAHGGSEYAVITTGQITLTESAVDSPSDFPQEARFRRNLALKNRQLDWLNPSAASVRHEETLYCILVYGPRGATQPFFAQIAIPDDTGLSAYEKIDLTDRLMAARLLSPSVDVVSAPPAQIELIPDALPIALSAEAKEKLRKQREEEERRRHAKSSGAEDDKSDI
ncbi:hypothetical protein WME88_48030 [Sorangium sp. So ce216]